jgi:hypothetical protein
VDDEDAIAAGRHRLLPVFYQPLRQTEGLLRSIIDILMTDIAIPDHATLTRREDRLTILPERIHQSGYKANT